VKGREATRMSGATAVSGAGGAARASGVSLGLLGLDTVGERIYRRMLKVPGECEQKLAESLGLSGQELAVALVRLRALGVVRPSGQPPHTLHAVSPQLGVELLLSRQEAALGAAEQQLREGRAAAARLISEFPVGGGGAVNDEMEFLHGIDSIRDFLQVLNSEVREEMLTFAPGGAQTGANMRAARPLNQRLLERGVQMRTVYLESLRRDRASVAHAEWLTRHGGEVRTTPVLPNRMIICDREVALVAVRTRGLLDLLCALFHETWQRSAPLGVPRRKDGAGLTPQQAEALRLLAEGCTDQAVAKHLGVSPRSARRTAAEVMTRLGARSRFQAGALAAQLGHLPGPDGVPERRPRATI